MIVSLFRTALTALTLAIATPVLALTLPIAALLGAKHGPGGWFQEIPRWWSACVLWAAGVKVRVHDIEIAKSTEPHIYAPNHSSWFDVPALSYALPSYRFVARSELFKVPVFGWGIRQLGMIPIERDNRKAAFQAYDVAVEKIRAGMPVVVFPEGTRGYSYEIRNFKKGPFVLAINAGVNIVPILIYGARDVLPKGSHLIRPGRIDIHLLEPVSAAGLTYSERDALAAKVRSRISEALERLYGIPSPAIPGSRSPQPQLSES